MTDVAYFAIKMVASALPNTKRLAQNALAFAHDFPRKVTATCNRLMCLDSLHDWYKSSLYSALTS